MDHSSANIVKDNYLLQPGYISLPADPTHISTVLGSCVAVCIYDTKHKIGGMNHFQYPVIYDKHKSTARYGNVATLTLIYLFRDYGSKIKHLKAQIFGGAFNAKVSVKNIGMENIRMAKRILENKNIKIIGEDTGGEQGRKIVFNTFTNEVALIKVEKLRNSDWYPYQGDR